MDNKFRDELIKIVEWYKDHKDGDDLVIDTMPCARITVGQIKALIALLSGTHEEFWLAPREATSAMRWAGSSAIGERAAKECFELMRDASEKERRG